MPDNIQFIPDPNAEQYVLWTVQNEQVYQDVLDNGVYHVSPSRIIFPENDDSYIVCNRAYRWLSEQMRSRVAETNANVQYPIWAWFKHQGKAHGKPDMRESGHGEKGEHVVRLRLEIPKDRVLLSDYDDWHFALNYWYLGINEADSDAFDEELKRHGISFQELQTLATKDDDGMADIKERIENSWEKMFDVTRPVVDGWNFDWAMRSIQATFWELRLSDITQVEHFVAR